MSNLKRNELKIQVTYYLARLEEGDLLEITGTLPELSKDIKYWCDSSSCSFVSSVKENEIYKATIAKVKATGS